MSLHIDKLHIELPHRLGARRHAILQHLRSELKRLDWPPGQWRELHVPEFSIATHHTNTRIARQIAEHLYQAAKQLSQPSHKQPSITPQPGRKLTGDES